MISREKILFDMKKALLEYGLKNNIDWVVTGTFRNILTVSNFIIRLYFQVSPVV